MINYFCLGDDQNSGFASSLLYYALTCPDDSFVILKEFSEAEHSANRYSVLMKVDDGARYVMSFDLNESMMFLSKVLSVGHFGSFHFSSLSRYQDVPAEYARVMPDIQAWITQIIGNPQLIASASQYQKEQLLQWCWRKPYPNDVVEFLNKHRGYLWESDSSHQKFDKMYSSIGEIKHDLHFIYAIVLVYVILVIIGMLFLIIFAFSAGSSALSLYDYR